jgi:hypothetical protein
MRWEYTNPVEYRFEVLLLSPLIFETDMRISELYRFGFKEDKICLCPVLLSCLIINTIQLIVIERC